MNLQYVPILSTSRRYTYLKLECSYYLNLKKNSCYINNVNTNFLKIMLTSGNKMNLKKYCIGLLITIN